MGLNICFVSYWGINEGLTQATVLPHLRILSNNKDVDRIYFFTIERQGLSAEFELYKLEHFRIASSANVLRKAFDKRRLEAHIKALYAKNSIHMIMARGVMAGRLVLNISNQLSIPLSIESFEPHADYMLEDGVWKLNSLKYKLLQRAERQEKRQARFILPLTNIYAEELLRIEGLDQEKLMITPCCVNSSVFAYNDVDRQKVRAKLGIKPDTIVGIYTGKIGGIYLDQEALQLFNSARSFYYGKFHLLILSPDKNIWREKLAASGFSENEFSLDFVSQGQVAAFLSAADFAFSLHRPTPSKKAISPIKNAEFWANGLSIIMPDGIGDDSEITKNKNLGVVVEDFNKVDDTVFYKIDELRKSHRPSNQCVQFAKDFRYFDIVQSNYSKIIASLFN